MHKIIINDLGPVKHCELECKPYMVFTGFQASGKSTIAKAIFYFRTIKDDVFSLLEKNSLDFYGTKKNHKNLLIYFLREKFLRVFGSSWSMKKTMSLEYYYTEQNYIKVYLRNDPEYSTPNIIWVDFSDTIKDFLDKVSITSDVLGVPEEEKIKIKQSLSNIFDDKYETVYIPAGRSILTLMSQQLSYLYPIMTDYQKRMLDYCTQNYIERIFMLKPMFSDGYKGIIPANKISKEQVTYINHALELIHNILKGNYSFSDNEERINLDNGKYVKINFASSGQQESIWILNILFYYLVNNTSVNLIIEEPESHLFPESQKLIVEFISMLYNKKNNVLVTTHSPYVLGTLNNLLYANQNSIKLIEKIDKIIPKEYWVDENKFSAWFVKNGYTEYCMDKTIHLIQNEKIDEISNVINKDFNEIFELTNDE